MTRGEALKELDQLSRAVKSGPVSQREVLCPEMTEATRIRSVRKIDRSVLSCVRGPRSPNDRRCIHTPFANGSSGLGNPL